MIPNAKTPQLLSISRREPCIDGDDYE